MVRLGVAALAIAAPAALTSCGPGSGASPDDVAGERPRPSVPLAPAEVTAPSAPAPGSGSDPGSDGGASRPAVGECFDVRKDELSLREALVPCDLPHDDEIYAVFELPDGPYPGEEPVVAAAREGCVERFAAFVGVSYEASALEVTTFHPGSDAWASGDRAVWCSVWNPDDAVVGTLEGAAY